MTNETASPTRSGDSTSLLIGFMTGLRSATPLAATAWAQKWGWLQPSGVFAKSGSTPARAVLTLGAAGEFVADKLPFTPSRLRTSGLIVRAKLGGASAATVASATGENVLRSSLLGAVGAVLGSYAGYHFRVGLTSALTKKAEAEGRSAEGTKIAVAVVEDVIAVAGSLWVLSKARAAAEASSTVLADE
jgi:uncharacterized membrane protein